MFTRGVNMQSSNDDRGVSLAGQAAAGIQLSLKRNTSRLLLKLWSHVRRSRGYAILFENSGVSLTGPKVWPVFDKAKAQSTPVAPGFRAISSDAITGERL